MRGAEAMETVGRVGQRADSTESRSGAGSGSGSGGGGIAEEAVAKMAEMEARLRVAEEARARAQPQPCHMNLTLIPTPNLAPVWEARASAQEDMWRRGESERKERETESSRRQLEGVMSVMVAMESRCSLAPPIPAASSLSRV